MINLIAEFKQKILQIQNTDSLDDVKDLELYEFEMIDAIFEYGLKNKYSTEGFPGKYHKLFETEDENCQDFLSYDVKSYYVYKIALQHEDVFKMLKIYFNDPDVDYQDENCKEDILVSLKILETEGVNLTFNPESSGNIPVFRPKLPG
ncbi:hypothetical protein [Kaistella palustris]|uniref:hypothetical protein n=1 Tax=Kaistella palustris TaxID=493376 RepID=UPI0012EB90C1|nr:hypothetical protein [Kaistella palustris]